MKKIFILVFTAFFISFVLPGQKLNRKKARQILETATASLRKCDSTAFVNLWYLDNKPAPYHNQPFTEKSADSYFYYLREFLDTALARNLKIDNIEIVKTSSGQQALGFGTYNIKAWFRYSDKYYKGFGFFLEYVDKKWCVKYIPDTSTLITGG